MADSLSGGTAGTDGPADRYSPAAPWLDATERAAGHVRRLAEHMQQAQLQMFRRMSRDTQTGGEEAREAIGVQDLADLQMAYVAEECAHLAQFHAQVLSGFFSAQAQWTRDLEANAGALLGILVDDRPPPSAPTWPTAFAPAELCQAALDTWIGMIKALLDAIRHDLQVEHPAVAEPTRPARRRRTASRG